MFDVMFAVFVTNYQDIEFFNPLLAYSRVLKLKKL